MDITTYSNWSTNRLDIRFISEDFLGLLNNQEMIKRTGVRKRNERYGDEQFLLPHAVVRGFAPFRDQRRCLS